MMDYSLIECVILANETYLGKAMLIWILGSTVAHAVEQSLVYDLTLAGEPVGSRTVKIRYIPPTERESGAREIESFTEVKMTIAGKGIQYQQLRRKFTDYKPD